MSAPDSHPDELRQYLAAALDAAASPLRVLPQDADDPWTVRFRDARFDHELSIRQDRLVTLLELRSPTDAAKGLENGSVVRAIQAGILLEDDDLQASVRLDLNRAVEDAMYSGKFSVYLPHDEITVDVPIDRVNLDEPWEIGASAIGVMYQQLDHATGTTSLDREAMLRPVGDAMRPQWSPDGSTVEGRQIAPPAWSPPSAPPSNRESLTTASPVSQFAESYLAHRSTATGAASSTDFATPSTTTGPTNDWSLEA